MTKIPLRSYLKEIESAINEQKIDEAVAHCLHILELYPKHIDTYKLLGKAFLEAQRYENAVDIFQRILSSIPDDFLSHVGMSIIREDDNNLNAALWHMERAFEVQPYNPAIRDELRRLYNKLNGTHPAKARLTPGALARLYAKGGHLQQAITELNTTLAQQPKRADLLVLLAKAYAQSGDNVQAIRTCSLLLQDLPYCLEANRLLANLLSDTEREEDCAHCQQRLHDLDPYEAHISSQAPNAKDVPAQKVVLKRLDWGSSPTYQDSTEPKWATSQEIAPEKPEFSEGKLPDWLDTLSGDSASPLLNSEAESTKDSAIPDWMQEAGWESSSDQRVEHIDNFELDNDQLDTTSHENGSTEAEAATNIPEWMKSMAPVDSTIDDIDEVEAISENNDIDIPESDWIGKTDQKEQDPITSSQDALQPSSADDLPEWLQGLGSDAGTGEGVTEEDSNIDWLQELSYRTSSEMVDQPTILSDINNEKTSDLIEGVDDDDSADVESNADDAALSRLKEISATTSEPIDEELQPVQQVKDLLNWLEGLEGLDDSPDPDIKTETVPFAADEKPTEIYFADEVSSPETPITQADILPQDTPDRLHETAAETSPADDSIVPMATPDTLQEKEGSIVPLQELEPPTVEIPEATSVPETETELHGEQASEEHDIPISIDDPDSPMTLLEELAATNDISNEELIPSPNILQSTLSEESVESSMDDTGDLPDDLQHLHDEEVLKQEITASTAPQLAEKAAVDDTPDWLQDIVDEQSQKEDQPQIEPTDIPEWLQNIALDTPADVAASEPTASKSDFEPIKTDQPPDIKDSDETPGSLDEFDDSLAWLGNLSAKQGVPEDELFSSTETDLVSNTQETTEMPISETEDLQHFQENDLKEEIATSDTLSLVEDAAEDDTLDSISDEILSEDVTASPDTSLNEADPIIADQLPVADYSAKKPVDLDDPAIALAWLESLAVNQGVPEEELFTSPEARKEAQIIGAQDQEQAVDKFIPAEHDPKTEDSTSGEEEFSENLSETDGAAASQAKTDNQFKAASDIPKWLQGDSTPETRLENLEGSPIPKTKFEPITEQVTIEESPSIEKDLPDWLNEELTQHTAPTTPSKEAATESDIAPLIRDSEESETSEDQNDQTYAWVSSDKQETVGIKPDKKLDLNEASLRQLEQIPGLGLRSAQNIIAYRESEGPFTRLEDLLQIEGIEPGLIANLRDYFDVGAAEDTPKDATKLDVKPEVEKHHAKQLEAQLHLTQGNIDEAMLNYDQLIKKGHRIDEVIKDLESACYQYPVDVLILQTLGDAHMRADNLQEALRIYTKAEQLLRS